EGFATGDQGHPHWPARHGRALRLNACGLGACSRRIYFNSPWGERRKAATVRCCEAPRYFCSIRVENLTEPSFKISTRGAVPRIPMVATGVLTFMLPVWATSPAINVNVPLVRLIRLALEWPWGS